MTDALLLKRATISRCFCCGARAFENLASHWAKCTWCDMYICRDTPYSDRVMAVQINAALETGFSNWQLGQQPWHPTHRTLRLAATAKRLWYRWDDAAPLDLITNDNAGRLTPFDTFAPVRVGLVVLSTPDNTALAGMLECFAPLFEEVVVVIDAPTGPLRRTGNTTFFYRPLDGNFSDQRNAGTAVATGDWVFHLDTDESVSEAFCAALPRLAAAASSAGLRAIGFPRRNFVGGDLSDLFPDVQYRLIRREVCFENAVHERPDACRTGDHTIVSQHGAIDHYLSRERVSVRCARYDEFGQSPDRHADALALLKPFAP